MSDKTRNAYATTLVIQQALEDNMYLMAEYMDDGAVFLEGSFSLAELRAIVAAIESVPLE